MNNQNTIRGLLLAVIALLFIAQAAGTQGLLRAIGLDQTLSVIALPGYSIGTLSRPGPSLFPLIVAGMLLGICVAILVRARFTDPVPLDFRVRNIALITTSLICFALVTEYVNMMAGIAVLATMASLAGDDFTWQRTLAVTAALCAIALAMKKLLNVPLPLY